MTVSLCVVAYNEEKFLPQLFQDFRKQTYTHNLIEIVLVDSCSTDKTKQIMENFANAQGDFLSVIVVDNPKKVQASGWNVAIATASGDVIVRIDAHTHIPAEFVENNIKNIEGGEYVSGGVRPCLIENKSKWAQTLLEVENSLFGSSINGCRRKQEKKYVKTMFHAAYRREVFEKVGGFNENLLRTEDNEMHYRVRKAGYKLSFSSDIISYQYARNNLKRMVKQKYGNGKWIGLTLGVCPQCLSLFHLIPLTFLFGIFGTTILAVFGFWYLSAVMWGVYGLFAGFNTIISFIRDGFLLQKLLMPFLFLILHISYGIGTLIGIIKMPFKRKILKNSPAVDEIKQILIKKKLKQ